MSKYQTDSILGRSPQHQAPSMMTVEHILGLITQWVNEDKNEFAEEEREALAGLNAAVARQVGRKG